MIRQATILCVDDEPSILDSLRRLFRKEGCNLMLAGSGEDGLAIVREQAVDLILADHRMPGMTGVEFLQRARQIQPEAIRIILSGYTDVDTLTAAINDGHIFRFVSKPWNNEELKYTVRQCLEQARLMECNRRLTEQVNDQNEELRCLNENLEALVEERTRDLLLRTEVLQVSQSVLDGLPVAVVGIDRTGLIVAVNQKANALPICQDGILIAVGDQHNESFPNIIVGLVQDTLASGEHRLLPDYAVGKCRLRITCSPFGNGQDEALGGVLLTWDILEQGGSPS